jgi:hypothetical protein
MPRPGRPGDGVDANGLECRLRVARVEPARNRRRMGVFEKEGSAEVERSGGYQDRAGHEGYPSDQHRLVWLRLLAERATLRLALRSTDAG